jgi:hypothetical protein
MFISRSFVILMASLFVKIVVCIIGLDIALDLDKIVGMVLDIAFG